MRQRRRKRRNTARLADQGEDRGDLLESVSAPPQLMRQQHVTHVVRAVEPVARPRITVRRNHACRGADTEPACKGTDEHATR